MRLLSFCLNGVVKIKVIHIHKKNTVDESISKILNSVSLNQFMKHNKLINEVGENKAHQYIYKSLTSSTGSY